jgi:hypothetical protein
MQIEDLEVRELGGVDPLDSRLPERGPRWWSRFRVRAALGLKPALAPALVFIPIGAMLGPAGLDVLSLTVISHLDPLLSAALVVLGVFIGRGWGRRRPPARVLAAASVEAGFTTFVVAGAIWFLLVAWNAPLSGSLALAAVALGIVSSVSSAPEGERGATPSLAASIADFDDVVPILLGALVLAFAHPLGPDRALLLGAWTVAFSVLIAVAADLLFRNADGAERGAFLVGALALLAGGAAYVGGSALLAGFVAGLLWSRLRASEFVLSNYLGKLQHPLMVLLLLVIGALVSPTMLAIWIAVPMVLFRLTGKVAAAALASRIGGGGEPLPLAAALVAPGILGVAFALQFAQLSAGAGLTVASAAALATVANEALGLLVGTGAKPA